MTPTVILTRPKAQSESFATALKAAWEGPVKVIISPLIEIVAVDAVCEAPDAVVFTSANGVLASKRLGLTPGLTAWCVGAKTAELARDAGFVPIVGPGDADGLVAGIIAANPSGKFAHIRGRHARGDVSARLNAAGVTCADVVAYDQKALRLSKSAKSAASAQTAVVFPVFSPRTAAILSDQGPFAATVHVVALSQAVKSAVSSMLPDQVIVAASPDADAMLAATLDVLSTQIPHG